MGKKKEEQGCCPDTHAKYFEIILIIGFLLSIILLIINMILNLWYFKGSTFLLIFEIVPIAFNAFSIILSIILRMWRSDDSVLKKNFSSSRNVSYFLLVLILINLLSTITEVVLYSFVYNQYHLADEYNDCETKDNCSEDKYKKLEEKSEKLGKILEKIINNPKKISYHFKDDKEVEKKYNILKLLPWIAFCFNLFIQLLMAIFDIILMGRIKIKNHFGFPKDDNNQSDKNKIIDDDINEKKGSKKKKKSKKVNGIDNLNAESDATELKKQKDKKKKKRRKSTKKEHN